MPGFPEPDRAGMMYTGKTPGTGIIAVSGDIMVYPETHGRAASPRWRGMGRTTGDPWRICLRCTISIWGGLPGHGSPHMPHSMQCRHERSMLMPLASPIPPGILITPDRNPIHSLPGDPETPAWREGSAPGVAGDTCGVSLEQRLYGMLDDPGAPWHPAPPMQKGEIEVMRFSNGTVRRMYADKVVDCIGACQSPMLTIDTEMKVLERGQVLQVMTDDPDLAEKVRAWAGENGHAIEEEHAVSGVTTLIMRKEAAVRVEAE